MYQLYFLESEQFFYVFGRVHPERNAIDGKLTGTIIFFVNDVGNPVLLNVSYL